MVVSFMVRPSRGGFRYDRTETRISSVVLNAWGVCHRLVASASSGRECCSARPDPVYALRLEHEEAVAVHAPLERGRFGPPRPAVVFEAHVSKLRGRAA